MVTAGMKIMISLVIEFLKTLLEMLEELNILLKNLEEDKERKIDEKPSITIYFQPFIRCLNKLFSFFTPENLVALHRKAFKIYWHSISVKKNPGREPIDKEIRELIRLMVKDNRTWGAPRIHGELLKLGFEVSERSVSRYFRRIRNEPHGGNKMKWKTFLRLQKEGVAGMDFFTVPTLSFRQLYGFFIIDHKSRKLLHFNVTYHPTSYWLKEQLVEAFSGGPKPKSIKFDRASIFSPMIFETLKSLGIEPKQIDVRSPWQNGIAERWVGNCRRDLLDHVIILNQQHLYRLLKYYVEYYNSDRTHYCLDKETPLGRPVLHKQGGDDKVISLPRCYGLHHKYIWKKFA